MKSWLKHRLTEKRFLHSLAVEERAVFLAGLHCEDASKAALAGMLHDCCHCMDKDEQLKIIESHGILLDDFTLNQPQIWHAIAGGIVIRDELGIADEEIINAVRLHTTGGAGMTKFEQIIYLADLTSSDRDYPDTGYYRELSEKNLGLCMLNSLKHTIGMLISQNAPIVQSAWEAYNYFWKLNQERN